MTEEDLDAKENGQSEPAAQALIPDKGPDREQMAESYLPEGEDWQAKTVLDVNDPAALAALSQLGAFYPEVEGLQENIDAAVHVFLKSRTSVRGASRDEYKDILINMFGGNTEEQMARGFQSLLAGDIDDD